ncbi:sporulation-specific protein 22 [Lecanora helva]
MAPIAKKFDKEQKVQNVLDFAKNIEISLSSDTVKLPSCSDLRRQIDQVAAIHHAAAASKNVDLDRQGTRLWNAASTLKSKEENGELLCLIRVFACLLIDCAQRCSQGRATSNEVRVLRTALKACKLCLDQNCLNLADIIVERAAFYDERLKSHGAAWSEANRPSVKLVAQEYLNLRISLAWHQERLDLAKLMLAKVDIDPARLESSSAEELADTLYEIGRSQSRDANWTEAIFWLGKAHDAITGQEMHSMSPDAEELKIAILHGLARAFVDQGTEESREKAWDLIHNLDVECGNRLAVSILKLDALALDPEYHPQDYSQVLLSIVNTAHLTDTNIKTVLNHTHKLRARSPSLAHTILSTLLLQRLLGAEKPKWVEKVLVTIIWNYTSSTDLPDPLSSIGELLDTLVTLSVRTLSPSATHATQILLWKRIETSYNQDMFEMCEAWCTLCLHSIFGDTGVLNIGKVQRKLMLCALGNMDPTKARDVYNQMSASNKKDPSSQYLLYKVALRLQDLDLATECLDAICTASAKDATLLYACVLEAQQSGDQVQVVHTLQRVLTKYGYSAPNEVHLPALLRLTARLLVREAKSQSKIRDHASDICNVFEGAAVQAKRSRQDSSNELFTTAELDWFSRNSYNLCMEVCTTWKAQQTLRLVSACVKFIDLYPAESDINVATDLSLRRLFCNFLSASLLIVLARAEDNVADQLQHYLNVRKSVNDFRTHVQEQVSRLEGGAKEDLQRKYGGLLAFDFEAAARLKAWDDLSGIINETQSLTEPQIFAILADITLSSEAPSGVMITTLQQIINITWQYSDRNSIEKLSRWIRCLFTIALSSNEDAAEHLLNQVTTITKETRKQQSLPYPPEELEWLVATSFNHAIDLYCATQEAACRRWAERALALSDLCDDGGRLHGLLQEKYLGLSWRE